MGLYDMSLSMSLLGFGLVTMLANFHMCGIMMVLKSRFQHACEECEPMCFRCLMFSLSGPCELLCYAMHIALW